MAQWVIALDQPLGSQFEEWHSSKNLGMAMHSRNSRTGKRGRQEGC